MMTVNICINEKLIHKFYIHNLTGGALSTYEIFEVTESWPENGDEPEHIIEHWRKDGAITLAKKVLEKYE